MKHKLTVAVALAIMACGAASADLIQNGGFEQPDLDTAWAQIEVPGWFSDSGDGLEIQTENLNGWLDAQGDDGDQWLEIDGPEYDANQEVALSAGDYMLSFAFSYRPGVAINTTNVYWNNDLLATLNADGSNANQTDWAWHAYTVSATEGTNTLRFEVGADQDTYGGFIDDVSLQVVPEPASMTLLGLGLAAVTARRFRKRN